MRYTSDNLIAAIKRNAGIPTSQRKFSNTDFLTFLNEELQLTIVGELISMRQDYFVETQQTALVANTSEYNFPSRAIGWKVDSVGYVDASGDYTKLYRVNRSQRDMYSVTTDVSSPAAYYIEGTKIVTIPSVGTSPVGSLEVDFVRIQNELVLENAVGAITTVATVGTDYQMTVGTVPTTTSGVDVISGTNPFNVIARGAAATVAGSNVSVVMTAFDRAPVSGDFLCETGKTPVPGIPEDIHPVLAQAATIRCLIASNDMRGIQSAQLSLGNMLERMRARSRNRVNSSPNKIVTRGSVLNMMRSW